MKVSPVFSHYLHVDTIKENFQFYEPLIKTSKALNVFEMVAVKTGKREEALCQEIRNISLHKCLYSKRLAT